MTSLSLSDELCVCLHIISSNQFDDSELFADRIAKISRGSINSTSWLAE